MENYYTGPPACPQCKFTRVGEIRIETKGGRNWRIDKCRSCGYQDIEEIGYEYDPDKD